MTAWATPRATRAAFTACPERNGCDVRDASKWSQGEPRMWLIYLTLVIRATATQEARRAGGTVEQVTSRRALRIALSDKSHGSSSR